MKKAIYILTLLFTTIYSVAQTTSIPDANFEQELINLGLDVVLDGQVLTANIDTVTNLNVHKKNISSLTGIVAFTALLYLICDSNSLTSLDVTQLTVLDALDCSNNPIVTLDVTQNTVLTYLYASYTQITSLDVSQNTALWSLFCSSTLLTSLNLTQNTSLRELECSDGQLTCLNMKSGFNTLINFFYVVNNPNLICIEVDNVSWSTMNWVYIDSIASFSMNCGNPCSVGLDGPSLENLLSIYPNPSNGSFTIDLKDLENANIEIYSIFGQRILKKPLTQYSTKFNLSKYSKGVYFIKVETNNKTIVRKIVLQ